MSEQVQVKCARCLCIATFDPDDAELARLNRTGKGMPRTRARTSQHCPCICHEQTGQLTRLVSRTIDFGDEPPY